MSTTTTTVQSETSLRRRTHALERAHSRSSLDTPNGKGKATVEEPEGSKHNQTLGQAGPSSPVDNNSDSGYSVEEKDSSDGEDSGGSKGREGNGEAAQRTRLRLHTNVRRPSSKERSPMSPTTRAWYEFDLAVVVALVSPIGNWLTGGDHVKNLVLIILLIFYLHQIIEIPWALYQKSRPRTRVPHIPSEDPTSPQARYSQIAASELHKFELFFLFLTFLSPLLGALLLRYASEAILGPEAVSWFSTGLFVLATGVRPWAHLIDRLNQRTAELHDFVLYPPPTLSVSEEAHQQLEQRVAQLEKALGKMRTKVAHATEDVYEYVDDAVDAVEHAMRKQERKWDKYEGKVNEVEQVVGQLHAVTTRKEHATTLYASLLADISAFKSGFLSTIDYFTSPAPHKTLCRGPALKTPMRSLSGTSTPLETIVEEEHAVDTYPLLGRLSSITSSLVYRAGYLATLPLRAVARMVFRNY
ncbi:unnamed protein product [Cyclocybe aegerita]|uniref:Uncharacterized protein n=1 Tax=Cyclocybe aegerita TaxID=1973307 RepID=A0A8S0XIZ2_CYCAE|nr:unnamed protein product [Cyclocybe aegerita]